MSAPPSKGDSDGIRMRRRVRFQDLMRYRVHHILLVSSLYDSFILAEDGQVNEIILNQFLDLNLSHNPDLTRVSTGAEALERLHDGRPVDLIISSMHVGDMDVLELTRRVRASGAEVPIILLAYNNRDLTEYRAKHDISLLERVFLWQGDVRILLAMVKYLEDRRNVPHDTGVLGVPAIIVVEDNVRYYSSFLPMIYTELMAHTQHLVSEGVNLTQKVLRMRTRPKILLCDSFDEAWEYFDTYRDHILGVISDIEFPWSEGPDDAAGVALARRVREVRADLPIMLQSSRSQNEDLARTVGAAFVLKGSPDLLQRLRSFISENFGFGDFVFRNPDGTVLDRAADLKSLVRKLHTVSAESIAHHGERNHFSNWLKARGEFALAHRLRPRKVSDYPTLEHLRQDLIRSIGEYRRDRDRIAVADFSRKRFDPESGFSRIGGGSLGGKARGLAFVNRLLYEYQVRELFDGVSISVPTSVVLGTDIFDQFLDRNRLRDLALRPASDEETVSRFLEAPFPEDALRDLRSFLEVTGYPLAVRSSGLLEDSPSQPFAGVYETFMIPNNHPNPGVRLDRLVAAVKRVYASTFSRQAKAFLQMTPYRLEEEKMAVIIQRVVGRAYGDRFYPDFAGVARSHDFYPLAPARAEDGIAVVALGLGKTVVEGGACLRFCPSFPRSLVAQSSVEDTLRDSQREFWALRLDEGGEGGASDAAQVVRLGLKVAEGDGTLSAVGSTYSPDNDVVYDGISRPGIRLVSFAPILKHGQFPLADLLKVLLKIGSAGTSSPVEIEFAVNLRSLGTASPEFGFLQMRPMALSRESEVLEIGDIRSGDLLCRSSTVLGNGNITDVYDMVVVDYERFDRSKSREAAQQVANFNALLQSEGRPYLLVGVGRWGSADPFLGIPVRWSQIAGARVIVEAGFRDLHVTPSQGTHFFQNLTSCNTGYFTVNPDAGDGFIDWDWIGTQPSVDESGMVRHLRFSSPLTIKMSGLRGEGVVLKPGA